MFLRTQISNLVYDFMRKEVISRLKKEGYNVLENAKLEDGTTVNFLGEKDGKKFAVYIFVRPTKKSVAEKEKHYAKFKDVFTDYVFAVPSHAKFKPEKRWEFNVIDIIGKSLK